MSAAALALAVASVMARVDALTAQEPGKDAREVAALDKRADALFKELAPLGWRAAAPLGAAASDLKRAPKSRFFAAVFLTKLHDPAAFEPLSKILLDADQDPDARQSAAEGLAELDVPPAAPRRSLCAALALPDLPRPVADQVLIALTRLGCDDPAALEREARAYGPRPSAAELVDVRRALAGLSRSRDEASAKRLLVLAGYFPPDGAARAAAIAALAAREKDYTTALAPEALGLLREALRSETADPAAMLVLVKFAAAFGPQAADLLLPLASHDDAEVLAAAAEVLARRKDVRALPALDSVIAGAMRDPRFAPKPGRPDPAVLLERIENAAALMRREKSLRQ
jgi:hypothetical protein